MISSYVRGHLAEYDGEVWRYSDTKDPISIIRSCKWCGEMPTIEGYDGCLGYIPNALWACCGHGIAEPKIIFKEN